MGFFLSASVPTLSGRLYTNCRTVRHLQYCHVCFLPSWFFCLVHRLSRSVSALRFSCAPRNYLVAKISDALLALPDGKVSLERVPSRMGISGNEEVDSLASPRSLDLTPPYFFTWEYLKGNVYINMPNTLHELKNNIIKKSTE